MKVKDQQDKALRMIETQQQELKKARIKKPQDFVKVKVKYHEFDFVGVPLSPKSDSTPEEGQQLQNHFPKQVEPPHPQKKQLILHQDEDQENTYRLKSVKEELEHDNSQLALIHSQLNTYLVGDENPTQQAQQMFGMSYNDPQGEFPRTGTEKSIRYYEESVIENKSVTSIIPPNQ
ncbi:hypothetical protein FGO68_gene11386 [Halteria grandinella]|uniref:Uncharacterized protein n=1 Tax=Halteria grandinella TaxID=5974 RepID=A0A8J8P4C9_HALGN|nr:hypothetical protein FGO68_gene11386 [Halteria grandinella]